MTERTPLINEHLDKKILQQNYRLNYLFKINEQLRTNPRDQHTNVVKTFVANAHIPAYMLVADIKAVAAGIYTRRHQAILLTTSSLFATVASFGYTVFAQLTNQHTLIGSLTFLLSSAFLAMGVASFDKLFVRKTDIDNLNQILEHFEKVGEAND